MSNIGKGVTSKFVYCIHSWLFFQWKKLYNRFKSWYCTLVYRSGNLNMANKVHTNTHKHICRHTLKHCKHPQAVRHNSTFSSTGDRGRITGSRKGAHVHTRGLLLLSKKTSLLFVFVVEEVISLNIGLSLHVHWSRIARANIGTV